MSRATHLKAAVVVIAAVFSLSLPAGKAQAEVVTLADLLVDGANIICGDKLFHNFSGYASIASGGAAAVDPSDIGVMCTTIDGEHGLRFTSNAFVVFGAGQMQVTGFQFDVTSTVGNLIHDNTLTFASLVQGDAAAVINESVEDLAGEELADKFVFNVGGLFIKDRDHREFDPRFTVHITKNIVLASDGGIAGILTFEQTFSQVAVPEPATLTLFGLGLVGLVGYRWRRSLARPMA